MTVTPEQLDEMVDLRNEIYQALDRFLAAVAMNLHNRCYWCHLENQCDPEYVLELGEHLHPYVHTGCLAVRASISWDAVS